MSAKATFGDPNRITRKWLKDASKEELECCMGIYGYPTVRYYECKRELERRQENQTNTNITKSFVNHISKAVFPKVGPFYRYVEGGRNEQLAQDSWIKVPVANLHKFVFTEPMGVVISESGIELGQKPGKRRRIHGNTMANIAPRKVISTTLSFGSINTANICELIPFTNKIESAAWDGDKINFTVKSPLDGRSLSFFR